MRLFNSTKLNWVIRTLPVVALMGLFAGCAEATEEPTPEGPALLSTVRAYMSGTALAEVEPTPEGPAIAATLEHDLPFTVMALLPPSPDPATPEAPSIMSTVTWLLATPSPTPLPTNTPGPTPTPRSSESATPSIRNDTVQLVPVRLEIGERIEGFFQGNDNASFTIQDPNGTTVRDYGATKATNFQVTATMPGLYSLVFRARPAKFSGEPVSVSFSYSYTFNIYGW